MGQPQPVQLREGLKEDDKPLTRNEITSGVIHDDDHNIDNSSDISSVLSASRMDEWFEPECDAASASEKSAVTCFQAKWDTLEQELVTRRARLEKIAVGKCPSFVRQLRRRENEVSLLKREELLLEQIEIEKSTSSRNKARKGGKVDDGFHRNPSRFQRVYDAITFELNSAVPAVFSLVLHCIAVGGIFEGFYAIFHSLYRWVQLQVPSESARVDFALYGAVLLIGITFLRCTGFLYWWLSDQDYDCLKFDYHNRIRLRYPGARIIQSVRRSAIVRVVLYMVGYVLCYMTAQAILSYISYSWGQQTRLMQNLPSKMFRVDRFQMPDAARQEDHISPTFLCERTCKEEIDRREAAYIEIQRVDREYTRRVLSTSSHYFFWWNWVQSSDDDDGRIDESIALFSDAGDLLFGLVVVVVGICLLRVYGFAFWEQY